MNGINILITVAMRSVRVLIIVVVQLIPIVRIPFRTAGVIPVAVFYLQKTVGEYRLQIRELHAIPVAVVCPVYPLILYLGTVAVLKVRSTGNGVAV